MQLALLLLSQPCHGTGQRLDGGNLSALGCGAWSDDPMPGPLVPSAQLAEADDRPLGLCGRGQSGSYFDERQGSSTSEGIGTQGLALPASSCRTSFLGRRARRCRGRGNPQTQSYRLAFFY